jgi:hypothetical protein
MKRRENEAIKGNNLNAQKELIFEYLRKDERVENVDKYQQKGCDCSSYCKMIPIDANGNWFAASSTSHEIARHAVCQRRKW